MAHSHSHGAMGLRSIDYIAYSSKLAGVNAGLKMLLSLFLIVFCVIVRNIPASILTAVLSAVMVIAVGKTGFGTYISVQKVPLGFLIVGGVAIAIDFSGIKAENIYTALRVMATAWGAVSAMLMLTLTTPMSEIIAVLEKLHVPKIIIELMNMIYRFIFIMSSTQNQMHVSAKARLGYSGFKTGLKTFGNMLGNLLIVSLGGANAYYDAMRARCYDGRLAFLTEPRKIKISHIALSAVYVCAVAAVWWLTR